MKHLVLLGWLLLLPPWVAPYKVNMNAPFSQWHCGACTNGKPCVFSTFQACADYKNGMMTALKNGQVHYPSGKPFSAIDADWNYRVYWNGRCVKQ